MKTIHALCACNGISSTIMHVHAYPRIENLARVFVNSLRVIAHRPLGALQKQGQLFQFFLSLK
jgi:hypothetical protein